MCLALTI
jgi:hypothetical protein